MDLADEPQRIYDSGNQYQDWPVLGFAELKFRLGAEISGFLAEETVGPVAEIVPCH